MKKTYIIPATTMVVLTQADGILNTLSGGDTLGYGGQTDGNVTNSDVKRDRGYRQDYNVWNDDWSQ